MLIEDSGWTIRIEQCKALATKKETFTCLQQVQVDKDKSDHVQGEIIGAFVFISLLAIIFLSWATT